jgi:hypothetical protein
LKFFKIPGLPIPSPKFSPGYLDPADRAVRVVLQQQGWTSCRDILRNQPVAIRNSSIEVTIPMGTLRIIDLIKE